MTKHRLALSNQLIKQSINFDFCSGLSSKDYR